MGSSPCKVQYRWVECPRPLPPLWDQFLASKLALTVVSCVNRGDWVLDFDAQDVVLPSGVSWLPGKWQIVGTPLTLTVPDPEGPSRYRPARLPLPRSLEPAQAVASDFQKGTTSFWVKGRFPGEMNTLFVVAFSPCVQKFGGFCVCFSFCFSLWELGGFQGSSLGWHTGCKRPRARVCAGH